ncbi:MAG TPA: hypothetical protein PLQ56_06705 [Aggregatilineales bacterium]|nr:hypothetical protein [Aggregatilineales bacterium]
MERSRPFPPDHASPAVSAAADQPPGQTFITGFGEVPFETLMERTRRYAAYIFVHSYHLQPHQVDEALHLGYSRLWEQLYEQPHRLAEKDVPGIGQQVVFQALHALRPEIAYRHQIKDEAVNGQGQPSRPHSLESRQIDLRLDLLQAIGAVAETILQQKPGKRRDHDLWALYGLTMLHTTAKATSQGFGVREQSMQKAFQRVREALQQALPHYAPADNTRPYRQRGREAAPKRDMAAIRRDNATVPETIYEAVAQQITALNADTHRQDALALAGIRAGISASVQAQTHHIENGKMRRAYERVHLLIAAARDPSIPTKRPEKRQQFLFTLTPESAQAVHDLALELMSQPRSFEKLVALHTHISNLPVSRTAEHFQIPTATLRYYVQQIGERLQTPKVPAGADRRGFTRQAVIYPSPLSTP